MRVIAIPARLNSSRFPRKLMQTIPACARAARAPVTVIEHAIDIAQRAEADQVVVITPDRLIATLARGMGAKCCEYTDPVCRNGSERVGHVAYQWPAHARVLLYQPDDPTILPADLNALFEWHNSGVLTAWQHVVSPPSPHRVTIDLTADGKLHRCLGFHRGQASSIEHVGLYLARAYRWGRYVQQPQSAFERAVSLEQLRWFDMSTPVRAVCLPGKRQSINVPEDWEPAMALLAARTSAELSGPSCGTVEPTTSTSAATPSTI